MRISRRDFVTYCGAGVASLALSSKELKLLASIINGPTKPTVLWLSGSGCTGCSISFLNRISTEAPKKASDVLVDSVNLAYHPNIMAAAGETAVSAVKQAYAAGNYILVVEGGVPTAFGGATCWAWTTNGVDVTFQQAVKDLASKAKKIVCIGSCASFGGMSAAGPNPTGVKSVRAVTGKTTINIPGCPPHPDWIVWAIVQILLNKTISVDSYGRPKTLFGKTVHEQCPRREAQEAKTFGTDGCCLEELGCRGPETKAPCPQLLWNGRVNWCVGANAPCYGCTESNFPTSPLWSGDD
jgi:hydrogenase small subunit